MRISRLNAVTVGTLVLAFSMLWAMPAHAASMTWYGPGFYGNRTACGKTLTERSLWVAALTPRYARCGMRLTIWARGKKYHVKVYDRGAFHQHPLTLDAAPGLRKRIGFYGTINIQIRKGWK